MGVANSATDSGVDLRDPAYLKIRDLIYRISGIYQPEEKLYLLASRSARRMSVVNAKTPAEYLERLTVHGNRDVELRLLLNEITIGETYMFRSPPQLEALQKRDSSPDSASQERRRF